MACKTAFGSLTIAVLKSAVFATVALLALTFVALLAFFAFAIFISLTIFHDKFYHDGLACIEYILQNTFSQAFFSKYI